MFDWNFACVGPHELDAAGFAQATVEAAVIAVQPRKELVGSVIPSFDTSAELSGRDIRDLVAKVRATGVKAIFSETSLPPRAAETIGREAGVRVVTGEGALYGDSLGPPGSDGDTYLKMIRHNTATIVSNLSGA